MKITIDDVRRSGYCVKGAKGWFAARGLDFRSFLKNGIDEETFIEKGDELALRVVEQKRKREGLNG